LEAISAARAHGRARPAAAHRRDIVAAAAGSALLGTALRAALGPGQANYDSLYALVWGRTLAHGHAPDFTAGLQPPTPHPLSTLVGAGLAAFGAHAATALMALAYLTLGAIGWLAFVVGRRWVGVAGGVVAAALVLTRETTLFYGSLAYFDLAFVALVLAALAVELRRPRAGLPVLGLLAVAGLWRPEAWLLSGAYGLYVALAPGERSGRARAALLAAALAAPIAWLAFDLVVIGDPLYSLTYTQDAAADLGRDTGVHAAAIGVPRVLGQVVRPVAAIGAVVGVGFVLAFWRRRALVPIGALVVAGGGTALAVAAGTPLNPRYLLLPATLCLLLCAAALCGWQRLPAGSAARRAWQAAAGSVALALAATAPGQVHRLRHTRDRLKFQAAVAADAAHLARTVRCGPPTLPAGRPVPLLALVLDRTPASVPVAEPGHRVPSGRPYLAPAGARVRGEYLLVRAVPPPRGLRPAAASHFWRLYGHCGA
jgi:hypothetical protein